MRRANRMACATLVINLFKEMARVKEGARSPLDFVCCLNVCTWGREYTHFFIYLLECMHNYTQLFHIYVCVCVCVCVCVYTLHIYLCMYSYTISDRSLQCSFERLFHRKHVNFCVNWWTAWNCCTCICTQRSSLGGVGYGWPHCW